MQIGFYGKKIGMTQIFNKNGNCLAATIIQLYNNNILKIQKNLNTKHLSILSGSNPLNKKKNIKKSLITFFQKLGSPVFKNIKEHKIDNEINFILKEKDILGIELFKVGEMLKISGFSSGKGTQGNIKRNNFKRGPMSHGSKHHRLQGSLGAGTTPGRVFPGKKMAGRMGNKKITISGIEILDICFEKNLIALKGSIPGKFGNLIEIKKIEYEKEN